MPHPTQQGSIDIGLTHCYTIITDTEHKFFVCCGMEYYAGHWHIDIQIMNCTPALRADRQVVRQLLPSRNCRIQKYSIHKLRVSHPDVKSNDFDPISDGRE